MMEGAVYTARRRRRIAQSGPDYVDIIIALIGYNHGLYISTAISGRSSSPCASSI